MASQMNNPVETGHIGLSVTNLGRSVEFYQQIFGFQVLQQSADGGRPFAFLGNGKTLVLTLWQQSNDKFGKRNSGLHHLSFQVGSLDEVRQAEVRVRAIGAKLIYDGPVAHAEGAASGGIYFEDPDGIRLEIYTPSGLSGHPAPAAEGPTCGMF